MTRWGTSLVGPRKVPLSSTDSGRTPSGVTENQSTADGQPDVETTFAILYDRIATSARWMLADRLAECREHAAERGWTLLDEYVDDGPEALHDRDRPALTEALVKLQRVVNNGHHVVLLVLTDTRISHSAAVRAAWSRRIELAGGKLAVVNARTPRLVRAGIAPEVTR